MKLPLISKMVAVGGAVGLAAMSASALELGDVRIDSRLGQPLRASIAFALGPNEALHDYCIFLRPPVDTSGIPSITRARVQLSNGAILLTGSEPVRDPLLNLRLAVDCPNLPHLQREFMLLLDPGETSVGEPRFASVTQEAAGAPGATPAVQNANPEPRVGTPRLDAPELAPIPAGTSYVVRAGETLSTIAARVAERPAGLWVAAYAVAEANPGAFVNGDIDRLMAGSTLRIPDLENSTVAGPVDAPGIKLAEQESAASQAEQNADPGAEPLAASPEPRALDAARTQETARNTPGLTIVGDAEEPAAETALLPAEAAAGMPEFSGLAAEAPAVAAEHIEAQSPIADDLEPGDVIIPAPEGVTEAQRRPVETPAIVPTVARPAETGNPWSWLAWVAGGLLAVAVAFVGFRRRLRDRFDPAAAGQPPRPAESNDDVNEPTPENGVIDDVDFEFDDAALAGATILDADLIDGTGLLDNGEVDVMQDFCFTASGDEVAELDLEISEDFEKESPPQLTDIIPPPHRAEDSSILKIEVLPEEDDYDLSMIVDATQQKFDGDTTPVDLLAVPADEDEYTLENDTLISEFEQKILEEDYQAELTVTRALDIEIEKAAREIADRLDSNEAPAALPDKDRVSETPRDDAMPAVPANSVDFDVLFADAAPGVAGASGTDMTAELTGNLAAGAIAENDESAGNSGAHETFEAAAAGSDLIAEMELEPGKTGAGKR